MKVSVAGIETCCWRSARSNVSLHTRGDCPVVIRTDCSVKPTVSKLRFLQRRTDAITIPHD